MASRSWSLPVSNRGRCRPVTEQCQRDWLCPDTCPERQLDNFDQTMIGYRHPPLFIHEHGCVTQLPRVTPSFRFPVSATCHLNRHRCLAPEWHMVAPPAGHHSRRERLGERARTTWGWATDQHLYMTPALARPRRAWPSPLATPVAACAGATECTLTAIAQHGAVHRFPQAS